MPHLQCKTWYLVVVHKIDLHSPRLHFPCNYSVIWNEGAYSYFTYVVCVLLQSCLPYCEAKSCPGLCLLLAGAHLTSHLYRQASSTDSSAEGCHCYHVFTLTSRLLFVDIRVLLHGTIVWWWHWEYTEADYFLYFRGGPCFISCWLTCSSFLLLSSATLNWPNRPSSCTRYIRMHTPPLSVTSVLALPLWLSHCVQGTLRVLLVLLHDFPEFLCDYHYSFCDVIPPNCIQMRNLILSAFPRNMRLPDPFTPNLKVSLSNLSSSLIAVYAYYT